MRIRILEQVSTLTTFYCVTSVVKLDAPEDMRRQRETRAPSNRTRWRASNSPLSIYAGRRPASPGADNYKPGEPGRHVLPVVSHCPDQVRELDHTDRRGNEEMIRLRQIVSVAIAVFSPVLAIAQGTTGTITGVAREEGTGRPVPNARVTVVGTGISVRTRDDGRYIIRGAPARAQEVLAGTMTGTGQRIRIRGVNSLSLSNDPIVLIDGIRMESATGSSSIGIGGSNPSRLSDIDPNQIESVEVVKGPSASTLYGTDAANGVIVITTKRGRVGGARWDTYLQHGRISDHNTYPTAYTLFGHSRTGALRTTALGNCSLPNVSLGTCVLDSVAAFNLFADKETTPLAPAYQEEYGAGVSGGSETLRYFLQGNYAGEQGVYKVPQFDIERMLTKNGGFIPGEQLRPNALTRATFRGNVNVQLSPLADIAVST